MNEPKAPAQVAAASRHATARVRHWPTLGRLLLIDGDPVSASFFVQQLERAQASFWRIDSCLDAARALVEAAEAGEPFRAVIAIAPPFDADGQEAAAALHATSTSIPVVLVSPLPPREVWKLRLPIGCHSLISSAADLDELYDAIFRWL